MVGPIRAEGDGRATGGQDIRRVGGVDALGAPVARGGHERDPLMPDRCQK